MEGVLLVGWLMLSCGLLVGANSVMRPLRRPSFPCGGYRLQSPLTAAILTLDTPDGSKIDPTGRLKNVKKKKKKKKKKQPPRKEIKRLPFDYSKTKPEDCSNPHLGSIRQLQKPSLELSPSRLPPNTVDTDSEPADLCNPDLGHH